MPGARRKRKTTPRRRAGRARSRYSAAARRFVSAEIRKLVRRGYSEARAIAAALDVARRKGLKVPARKNALGWLRPKKKKHSSSSGVVIGDSALALSYEGGQGKRSGKMRGPWEHEFESDDVEIIGRKDGSLILRSRSGERLWDHFEV